MSLSWWIKERHNPQLGIYYCACGQLSRRDGWAKENTLYGTNYMHEFKSEDAYMRRIAELKLEGARFV